jgi:hypothetical protein
MRGACGPLAAALICAAASSASAQAVRVRSLLEFRDEGVVRQSLDLTCGAAAIATLLTYQFGRPVSERSVVVALLGHTSPALVRARSGFSLLDLKGYVATQGLVAAGLGDMSLDDLNARAPAIVPLRWHGFRHFVVYRGRRGDRVLLADPAFGNRTLSLDAFKSAWAGGIAFIVFDPANPNPPNRLGAPPELFILPGAQAQRAVVADRQIGARP